MDSRINTLEELRDSDLLAFGEMNGGYIRLQNLVETQYGVVKIVSMTFSAILEQPAPWPCDLCRSLDGKTLPVGHPDFEMYQPPLHDHGKCLWIGSTTESPYKPPIDWKPPDKGLVEKFGNFIRGLPEKEVAGIVGVWEPTQTIETTGWAKDIQVTKLKNELMKEAQDDEAFFLLDGRNGNRILKRVGGKDYVELTDIDDIISEAKISRFVTFHNHPNSSSFSRGDLEFFTHLHPKRVRHHIIFGNDGTEYRLIFPKSIGKRWDEIGYSWQTQNDKIMNYYRERVLAGKLDKATAWKEHSHEIMKKLSEQYGFIYERVLP